MDAAELTALVSAVTALVTAVGGVIAVVRHIRRPHPPAGKGTP